VGIGGLAAAQDMLTPTAPGKKQAEQLQQREQRRQWQQKQ
jgi:hypothetical protein